ncbi:DNRLRE domain-containing protein [Micromonospora sp. NPDC048063]|uniref:DNRLRE domain-containing protein n=1 Tax=Micromonospora sp. NPDC048063 TaxID=3364256 RepID=UPI00371BC691
MPAPFMHDNKDDSASPHGKVWSDKVTQRVTRSGATSTITLSADAGWLADKARVYPVVIDPTIQIRPVPDAAQQTQIYQGAATTPQGGTYQLKVGTDDYAWRSLIKFPLQSSIIPPGTAVDDARLEMYYDQTHTAWEYDVLMEARRVTEPWSEETATWQNMNANMTSTAAGNLVQLDDGDAGTSVSGTWSYSGNAELTPLAVKSDYRYNSDPVAGDTHTWTPTITETGDYKVEAHYVGETDRTSVTYAVTHANGTVNAPPVNQASPVGRGAWATLGTYRFNAGTTGKVVLKDVAGKSVIVDAVRFTRWGVSNKPRAVSSAWNSFAVRDVVQQWLNGTANHGFVVKAVDEATKQRGGPIFEASKYRYMNDRRDFNLPRLIVTWGRPGVAVDPPTTVTSTGAVLTWPGYVDPSTSPNDDVVEYQVHRSVFQVFAPTAATLIAPLSESARSHQDTTAVPTAADNTNPMDRKFYYYMIAVKTRDGQLIAGPTQPVMLPKAGQITKIIRRGATAGDVIDTNIGSLVPNQNLSVYDGDPYVGVGNNSTVYGDTRGLIKFANLSGIPSNAKVVDAQLRLWTTYNYGPNDPDSGTVDVHELKQNFSETTATWNQASTGVSWSGGNYDPTPLSGFNGYTNDPEWETWDVTKAAAKWVLNPAANNFGLLLKFKNEAADNQRVMMLSSEAPERLLRPTLEVTYLEQTAESTYYAASTPQTLTPNATYTLPVTVSNPTLAAWNTSDWELSYDWKRRDETGALVDATDESFELRTALPKDVAPGGTVDVTAQVKTPPSSTEGNKRTEYILQWQLRNKITGKWLSETTPIKPLPQNVAVEEPTSDELGLEKFYSYAGKNTGAGGTLMNNLYAGNTVWPYNALSNPSRGLSTFVRLAYNSLDTSDTVAGYGWSLQASSMMRLVRRWTSTPTRTRRRSP